MTKKTLADISQKMKDLDICMLTTQTARGQLSGRPMSNNGEVEYDGNSYFFTYEKSKLVRDIEENAQVNLGFNGKDSLYISLTGKAKLIRNKEKMQERWQNQLKQWFPQGVDTPGIVMLHVKAGRIRYWQKEEEGEVKL